MHSSDFEGVLDELKALGVSCASHTRREKRLLWDLAGAVHSGVVMEIGSFEGYSTIILAKALANRGAGVIMYAIDPHTGKGSETDERESLSVVDTWPRFSENIRQAGVSDIVRGMKMKSEEAAEGWEKPVELLFIDGSHKYEDVKKDFLLWRPYLVPGGVVLFHDMWSPGVCKVIVQYVLRDKALGEFKFTPCCMLRATNINGKRYHLLQNIPFMLVLRLLAVIERNRTATRFLYWLRELLDYFIRRW